MSSEHRSTSPELEPEFLKLPEVAKILNISLRTVYQLIDSNELETHRFRGTRRIARADLDAYIERARNDTRPTLGERHAQAVRRPRRPRAASSA